MVDAADAIEKARAAVSERAELPGMSLMEHLDELRRRIIHSAMYLFAGFIIAWFFHTQLFDLVQLPLHRIGRQLVYTHPMDPLNIYMQVAARFWPRRSSCTRFGCLSHRGSTRKNGGLWCRSWRQR